MTFCRILANGSSVLNHSVIHAYRDDDRLKRIFASEEELVNFSPCDYIGNTTFDIGKTFEICACHITNQIESHCHKRRIVKKRYVNE